MNLIQEIQEKTEETYRLFEQKLGKRFQRPTIELKNIGRTAGYAYYNKNLIVINPSFAERYKDETVHITVPHECTHIITFLQFKKTGHGPHWKYLMKLIGLPPERCHNYSADGFANVVKYHCQCRDWELSTRAINNIKKGRIYSCPECKGLLVPGGLPIYNDEVGDGDEWL